MYDVAENLLLLSDCGLKLSEDSCLFLTLYNPEGCRAAHLCALTSSVPKGAGKGLPCALFCHIA